MTLTCAGFLWITQITAPTASVVQPFSASLCAATVTSQMLISAG